MYVYNVYMSIILLLGKTVSLFPQSMCVYFNVFRKKLLIFAFNTLHTRQRSSSIKNAISRRNIQKSAINLPYFARPGPICIKSQVKFTVGNNCSLLKIKKLFIK